MRTQRISAFSIATVAILLAALLGEGVRFAVSQKRRTWKEDTETQMRAILKDVEEGNLLDEVIVNTDYDEVLGLDAFDRHFLGTNLPSSVERHLLKSLPFFGEDGQHEQTDDVDMTRTFDQRTNKVRRIKSLRIRQEGTFFVGGKWIPYEAVQLFSTDPAHPAFVWDATMTMPIFPTSLEKVLLRMGLPRSWMPCLLIDVRDSYVRGRGQLLAKLMGMVTLARMEDDSLLDEGEVMRWLAESVLFPTSWFGEPVHCGGDAHKQCKSIHWTESPNGRTLSTVAELDFFSQTDRKSIKTRVDFRFDESTGLLSSIHASRPMATEEGGTVRADWEGRMWDYSNHEGVLVPTRMEVGWWKDGQLESYDRLINTEFQYDFYESW